MAGTGPQIRLVPRGNQMEVTWPANDIGYRVESSASSIGIPAWRPIREAATKSGGQYRLTIPTDSESGFFRLMGSPGGPLEEDYPGDYIDSNGDGIDGDFLGQGSFYIVGLTGLGGRGGTNAVSGRAQSGRTGMALTVGSRP